jgi:uncharacterized protein
VAAYRPRLLDPTIAALLHELPAILLVGPRAAGKTTTAARHTATVVRLDRPAEAAAFAADPDAALRGLAEPILLDEWQAVPDVLGAVKRAVDRESRPGRFLLTGSVRADLDAQTWPGTGRVVRLAMHPMTVAEQRGLRPPRSLFDRLAAGETLPTPEEAPDLPGYVELALRSGFPEVALARSHSARQRWLESYVDQIVTRDAQLVDGPRDPNRLRRYLEAYALSSAGLVEHKTIYEAAGINRKTALAYEQLLRNLFVVDAVPAWASNRLKRLIRSPKRYVIDAGLLVGSLRIDARAVMRDGDLLGRVLDTFVASQLRAEAVVATSRPRLYHLRQEHGRHEIDLLGELGGRGVVAVEVKADAAPRREAAAHLAWLRDQLGDRFVAGVVFHTGPRTYELDARIVAAPICTLWV